MRHRPKIKGLSSLTPDDAKVAVEFARLTERIKTSKGKGLTDLFDQLSKTRNALAGKGLSDKEALALVKKAAEDDDELWDLLYEDDTLLLDTGHTTGWDLPKKAAKSPVTERCAHSHPLITLSGVGTIQGGSCYTPQGVYDVEILLCGGAKTPSKILPWVTTFVRLPIVDGQPPSDFVEFDTLVDWTIERMKDGSKVHVGCIGGHGRTGTFLAALLFKATGEVDAVTKLRSIYCAKAVESASQMSWLHKHYGITKAVPSHEVRGQSYRSTAKTGYDREMVRKTKFTAKEVRSAGTESKPKLREGFSVWGRTKISCS